MFDFVIKKGSTSIILPVSLYDSSSAIGAKLAGLTYNSSGLSAYYNRMGASGSATAITLATATKGTWATGGFIAIDGTNMPGDYELHIPDAALATGANMVLIQLKGATNLVPKNILIKLVDNEDVDIYTIVNHTDYGNSKLVRSTTPANTLDVAETGEAGLDFDNVKNASSAKTLINITVPAVTDITNAVKISSGTGAGQLDITSGVVKSNLAQILGTAITETAGQIAAAFKKFFDKASPTGSINSLPDAVPGATGGMPTTNGVKVNQTVDLAAGQSIACADKTGFSIAGTIQSLDALNTAIQNAITALNNISIAQVNAQCDAAISDAAIPAAVVGAMATAPVGSIAGTINTLDALNTAIQNAISVLNNLSASQVNAACDAAISDAALATAEQLLQVGQYIDTEVAAILTIAQKLDTMLEADGVIFRYTIAALVKAPSGTGGDATAAHQLDIIDKIKGLMSKAHTLATEVGTFDPATDSAEAIRDRGDQAWLTGGGLSGSSTITITIHDGDGNPIPDVSVQVWNSALTGSALEAKISNALGQAQFTADDGAYAVKLRKAGYNFSASYPLTVSGNTAATLTGAALVIGVPADPGECRCYIFCMQQDGVTPRGTVNAQARIITQPEDADVVCETIRKPGNYSPTSGLQYWDIAQGSEVEFYIKECGIKVNKIIPALLNADITDMDG